MAMAMAMAMAHAPWPMAMAVAVAMAMGHGHGHGHGHWPWPLAMAIGHGHGHGHGQGQGQGHGHGHGHGPGARSEAQNALEVFNIDLLGVDLRACLQSKSQILHFLLFVALFWGDIAGSRRTLFLITPISLLLIFVVPSLNIRFSGVNRETLRY